MTQYAFLALGILLGVIGQFFLKTGADAVGIIEQFLRPTTIMGLGCYGFAAICYTLALRSIPVGTGYAVWTGIGAVGTAIFGMVLFAEPVNAARIACMLMIVAGIAGLKVFS